MRALTVAGKTAKTTARELWWLTRGSARVLWRYPKTAMVVWLVLGTAWIQGNWSAITFAVIVAVSFTAWCRLDEASFRRTISTPLWRRRRKKWIKRNWAHIASSCSLSSTSERHSIWTGQTSKMTYVPRLRRMRWTGLRLEIDLGLVMGQTVDDVAVASDRLGHAVDAERVQVQAVGRSARVIFSFANLLGTPFDARVPAVNESADPRRIYMGIAEDGSPWTVSLGASTLVAGSSGAGKASLIWGLMFGLGPSIKAQTVTVYGIDLKGGMELTMGEALFTRFATRPADAVELLEQAAAEMSERALRLGGHTRQHYPSVADPLVVVLIDELAAITAYLNDRPLRLRAEAAISLLCSQGRAVGYTVFACLQDPRKEVVPNRGLFTQMIALRLKDTSETVMVLGEGALAAGARCHQIPRSQPGVGFAIPEEGGSPVRVRAGFVSDDAIRLAAARFPAHRVITLPQEDYTSTVETETKSAK